MPTAKINFKTTRVSVNLDLLPISDSDVEF
jgi:hypothetical protein